MAILRLIIQPIPRDLASFWRKWEWRIMFGTDDGAPSWTIDYGRTRTERGATARCADALKRLTTDEQRSGRDATVRISNLNRLSERPRR